MTSESASSQLTHTISIPGQLGEPVTVLAAAGVSDSDFRNAIECTLFKQWLNNIQTETGLLSSGAMSVRQVIIQGVDMFGNRVGFLKFKADVIDKETGNKVPGIVFARGPAVAVLILLESDGETYVVLTEQVRVPVGKLVLELPAGMLDDDKGDVVGTAVREVEEETGLHLNLSDLVDLTAFLDPSTGHRIFPSPGGCDEELGLFLYRGSVDKKIIKQLQGKETGLRTRLMRYQHSMVKLVDFSPGEKYLVTYHSQEPSNPRDASKVEIKVFDVRTGRMMRDFKGSADEFSIGGPGGVAGASWPVFRWAGGKDDKYFAKLSKNTISVYETETFSLIDKKSMKVDNVVDICWSPTDSILSLFVPEQGGGNQPAKVALVQIPSKVELRQKNLFSVSDCKMYWQSSGEYLAVKVDRYTKTKKSTYSGFELFRIKERDIPIEVLELDNKNDKIIAFAWEPKGHRFAVIHGDQPRPDVSFYSMKTAQNTGRVSKLATLKAKQANALFWSPTGKYIILAGLKGFNGQLEFFNVDELETMATAEHFMATDIEWDPTGRYVATAVTSVHEMENGFTIWSFNGIMLYRILKDHFFQLAWRPRPPSFLTAEKEEEIAKTLKKYSKKYEAEDQDVSLLLSEQDREKRKALKEEWEKWVMQWKSLHEEEKLVRQNLRDGEVSDVEEDEYEAKEVEFEDLIDVTEEIVQES